MNTQPEKSFLAKLKERKVVRVGLVYILVGWILIQIGEATFEALILPDWSLALLIVIVFDTPRRCSRAPVRRCRVWRPSPRRLQRASVLD